MKIGFGDRVSAERQASRGSTRPRRRKRDTGTGESKPSPSSPILLGWRFQVITEYPQPSATGDETVSTRAIARKRTVISFTAK